MSTVSKRQFVDELSRQGGSIDINKIDPQLDAALQQAGASKADLKRIAGTDGVIRGKQEMNALFAYVDNFDKNGDRRSIATDKAGKTSKSGGLYHALRGSSDRSRTQAGQRGALRFTGNNNLAKVADGKLVIKKGHQGEDVKKVQQALIDMGYTLPGGASGTFDQDTLNAVRAFQRDAGIAQDGWIGPETLGALGQLAPAPGKKLELSAEYDKLYKDGVVNITLAIGFDDDGDHLTETRDIMKGLKDDGYKPIDYSSLTPKEKQKYNLMGDKYDPNAEYFHKTFRDPKTNKKMHSVVKLIVPGPNARDSYVKAMGQDEVVIYSGHARYGTGPDFDGIKSGKGNFVIDERGNRHKDKPPSKLKRSIKGRGSELNQVKKPAGYQLAIMHGCTTTAYLPSMRDQKKFSGRDNSNTDIIATTVPTWVATGGQHSLAYIRGVTKRQSNSDMMREHNKIEQDYSVSIKEKPDNNLFVADGFLGNAANREVQKTRSHGP